MNRYCLSLIGINNTSKYIHSKFILDTVLFMWPKLSVVNYTDTHRGFPGDRVVKIQPASAGHAREAVSIPGCRRSPAKGSGKPLQDSCCKDSMDIGIWQATVHGVIELTWLSMCAHIYIYIFFFFLPQTFPSAINLLREKDRPGADMPDSPWWVPLLTLLLRALPIAFLSISQRN